MKPLPCEGVMPLARKLGEIVGDPWPSDRPALPKLEPLTCRPVQLNPHAWGFKDQAEMDAAFKGEM